MQSGISTLHTSWGNSVLKTSEGGRQLWQVSLCETWRSQVQQYSWNPKHCVTAEINVSLTIDSGRTIRQVLGV